MCGVILSPPYAFTVCTGKLYLHIFHRMEFILDKCAKTLLKKENVIHTQNLILDIDRETHHLEQEKPTSKYLGNGVRYKASTNEG